MFARCTLIARMSACYCGVPYENMVDYRSLHNSLALRLAALFYSHIRQLDPCNSLCDSHSSFSYRASVEKKRNGTRSSSGFQTNWNRALLRCCVGVLGRSVLSIHVLAHVEYQRSCYNCFCTPYSRELCTQTSFGQVRGSSGLVGAGSPLFHFAHAKLRGAMTAVSASMVMSKNNVRVRNRPASIKCISMHFPQPSLVGSLKL